LSDFILEARDLSFGFERNLSLLSGISIGYRRGELGIVAGRNGAGKTLLAKCLSGLLDPSEGSILFEGQALRSLPGSPASRVAYVYQDARLQVLGDSVLDDCLFGLFAMGRRREEALVIARRALRAVGLGDVEEKIAFQLSGGELRRLAIAGVLALDPAVIILDEPFANLDYASVRAVLQVIVGLRAEGKAILVLTHELDKVLGVADRLTILDGGRLAVDGAPGDSMVVGIERYGLRDPRRPTASIGALSWLD
jgi:biotin transport system ATP-binding protein